MMTITTNIFIFSLLLLAETSVRYLFPLISSKYPFTSPKIRYKRFTLSIRFKSSVLFGTHSLLDKSLIALQLPTHLSNLTENV